jgi:hypothetical protein
MLSSTANGQVHSTNSNSGKKTKKKDQLRLFTFKHEIIKISVHLQTSLAAETHLAEGQWLKEQLNVVKLRIVT